MLRAICIIYRPFSKEFGATLGSMICHFKQKQRLLESNRRRSTTAAAGEERCGPAEGTAHDRSEGTRIPLANTRSSSTLQSEDRLQLQPKEEASAARPLVRQKLCKEQPGAGAYFLYSFWRTSRLAADAFFLYWNWRRVF